MSHKGQGMIIEIIIFGVVIFLSLAMFFLLTVSDSVEEENVEERLDAELGKVSGEAYMTYLLHQNIDQEISSGNEYQASFNEVIQAYFSTDGKVRINGESFERDEVRSDIEEYLTHSYPDSNTNMGSKINYPGTRAVLNISQGDDFISYRNGQALHGTERWPKQTRKIPTSNDNVEVELWINR